jgi:hypothetical protein
VFHTPVFRLCLAGAKIYYLVWNAARGKARWRPILAHPVYGPQWSRDRETRGAR